MLLNSFVSFFNRKRKSFDDVLELREPNAKNCEYRDELASKKPFSKKQKINNGSTYFESSESLIKKELEGGKLCRGRRSSSANAAEEKGAAVRVKVKMTKQEAAQMLSKCKNGGVLEFKDVARELAQLPMGRVSVESSPGTCCAAASPVLKSIPEEL